MTAYLSSRIFRTEEMGERAARPSQLSSAIRSASSRLRSFAVIRSGSAASKTSLTASASSPAARASLYGIPLTVRSRLPEGFRKRSCIVHRCSFDIGADMSRLLRGTT